MQFNVEVSNNLPEVFKPHRGYGPAQGVYLQSKQPAVGVEKQREGGHDVWCKPCEADSWRGGHGGQRSSRRQSGGQIGLFSDWLFNELTFPFLLSYLLLSQTPTFFLSQEQFLQVSFGGLLVGKVPPVRNELPSSGLCPRKMVE